MTFSSIIIRVTFKTNKQVLFCVYFMFVVFLEGDAFKIPSFPHINLEGLGAWWALF